MDCLEGMKLIEDNSVDLIVTDPPYGILNGTTSLGGPGTINVKNRIYPEIKWDNKPSKETINEIIRISKNQIIFGGEHLSDILPQSRGWYVWDKKIPDGMKFAQCELIWTSFSFPVKIIRHQWHGFITDNNLIEPEYRDHPTQKPLDVIRKLIINHSKEHDLICDPFMGSGTTAVACKQLNRNFIGFEISQEYVNIANERLKQTNLREWNQC
jgi:site-specific DNA-methyltransferase (adenine-specific)